jgi:hypothetical protein
MNHKPVTARDLAVSLYIAMMLVFALAIESFFLIGIFDAGNYKVCGASSAWSKVGWLFPKRVGGRIYFRPTRN